MRLLALCSLQAFGTSLLAQVAIPAKDFARFNAAFDSIGGGKIQCDLHTLPVRLDFAFRFEIRYILDCPLNQVAGKETDFKTLLRVSSSTGKAFIMGDEAVIPALPPKYTLEELHRLKTRVEFSGAFAVGEGDCSVEYLAFDTQRVYRRKWRPRAIPSGDENKVATTP
jgi:hypothetical protein